MENLEEVRGQVITVGGSRYYVLNLKKFDSTYYSLCLSSTKPIQEKIFDMQLKNGGLYSGEYKGENYQAIMEEFHKRENMEKCLEFIKRQNESLAKEESFENEDPAQICLPEEGEAISDSKAMAAFEELARQTYLQRINKQGK
jgi:hypothetical protein